MTTRDKQINEMIETTMVLAKSADALGLKVITCLYRMAAMELTNLVDEETERDDRAVAPVTPIARRAKAS